MDNEAASRIWPRLSATNKTTAFIGNCTSSVVNQNVDSSLICSLMFPTIPKNSRLPSRTTTANTPSASNVYENQLKQ